MSRVWMSHVTPTKMRICGSSCAEWFTQHIVNDSWHELPQMRILVGVTWLIHTRDMIHSCVTWLIHISFALFTRDLNSHKYTFWYVWHDSFISVTCRIFYLPHSLGTWTPKNEVCHAYEWVISYIPSALQRHTGDMTRSYVQHVGHDSFICATWLIHSCDLPYSNVTWPPTNESRPPQMSHDIYNWVISRRDESCHIWMGRVT